MGGPLGYQGPPWCGVPWGYPAGRGALKGMKGMKCIGMLLGSLWATPVGAVPWKSPLGQRRRCAAFLK